MPRFRLFAWATGACVLACSGGPVTQPDSASSVKPSATTASTATWNLTFHLSGGFAGFDRELQLASSGELTASDRKRNLRTSAKAPSADLSQIAALLVDAKSVEPVRPRNCSDCLQYVVEIQEIQREKPLVWHLNDLNLESSGLGGLVKALMTLMDRALTGQLKA